MARRTLSRLTLVIGLSLVFPASLWAQTPPPRSIQSEVPAPLVNRSPVTLPGKVSITSLTPITSAPTQPSTNAPAVAAGQPGLSFRYERTFGVTEQAYTADTQHLNNPGGLYIDGANNVFVVENRGGRVLRYNSAGNNTLALGTAGLCFTADYVFCSPQDAALDASGNLWVADGNRVVEYSSAGVFSQTIPPSNSWQSGSDSYHFSNVNGVAFDQLGHLFVSDSNNQRVQVYSFTGSIPVYSSTIGTTGVSGSGSNQFNWPVRIATDNSNRIYVVDNGNNRVQRCTVGAGWACTTFDSSLNNPQGVSVDTSGNAYISDAGNNRIRKCTSSGICSNLITGFPGWAADVATDSSGNVYVAGGSSDAIHKYSSSGSLLSLFKGVLQVPYVADTVRLNQPSGVAVDPNGNLYIAEDNGDRMVKISSDGTQQWAFGQAGYPGGDNNHLGNWWGGVQGNPAIDTAGRIVVPDTGNGRIQLLTPNGTLFTTFGSGGTGIYQFNCPSSVAVNPVNGDVLVADRCNQRIQVYTSKYVYKATIGITGTSGTDGTHFNNPWGVAADTNGNIYVADSDNHRVQKCTLSGSTGTCTTFAGVTGAQSGDFGHFSHPTGVAVDAQNNVYVSDEWNNRVLVFDASGAFLTNIAGSWGPYNGQLRNPRGVAVGSDGSVYVSDSTNHRIQKYARGVPGWQQVNVSGFGQPANGTLAALAPFSNTLYAGTANYNGGAQLWRATDGVTWTPIITDGFGHTYNIGIQHLAVFSRTLYAGTRANPINGGELWRSDDGLSWTRVVSQGFGDASNGEVFHLTVFSDTLYASTWSYTYTHGAEIWRSTDGLTWTRSVSNGFGSPDTKFIPAMTAFNGYLYAGTYNYHWTSQPMTYTGGAVWRTDGSTWEKVSTDGFGLPTNYAVSALEVFSGSLYAAVANDTVPLTIYRCQICDGTDWVQSVHSGPSLLSYYMNEALIAKGGWLYWATAENDRGETVLRSANGTDWERIADMGFGTYNDCCSNWSNSVASFDDRLYIGSGSSFGGQIWKRTVTADFTSGVTAIKPGGMVTFTNTSAGEYITSTWNFGDGTSPVAPQSQVVTHSYATAGTYTVTLAVDDGVDTNMITRTSYIKVGYRAYLPIVQNNAGAVLALYDDFNDPSFDGFYNPLKWQPYYQSTYFSVKQQSGALVFSNTLTTPGSQGYDVLLSQPPARTLRQLQQYESRLKISSDHTGGWSDIHMFIDSPDVGGHGWWTQCGLGAGYGDVHPWLGCDVHVYSGNVYTTEFYIPGVALSFDTWYTVRIEANPSTGQLKYYLNNSLIGSYTPSDALALITLSNFDVRIGLWNGDANSTATRYVDDVKITPAFP